MIKTEAISPSALKIVPSEKLTEANFQGLAPQVDVLISRFGQVRLLIDVSAFNGWESYAAFRAHASFIKNHQQNVERIAVIVGHDWQHWLVDAVRMFLHPEARAFDKSWVVGD
jgi:SpoIIAA-like